MATMATCATTTAVTPFAFGFKISKFFGASSTPSVKFVSNGNRMRMSAEWLPGQPRPAYLDGSIPEFVFSNTTRVSPKEFHSLFEDLSQGNARDFGFDPLGLAEVPENYKRYQESELIHARWAMLAVPGVLIPKALGLGKWVSAQKWAATPGGQDTYFGAPVPWGTLPIILAVEFLAIAFVESKRNDEPDFEKRKYPDGAFDPLGFSKDPKKLEEYKLKEIKNGHLALLAFVGFSAQAIAYPGTGPLENLSSHLSNPWANNIANIIIPRSVL